MILSLLQTKGGTGKTTLAKCLAYSITFNAAFETIALIEMDIQGTLKSWHDFRHDELKAKDKVKFVQLLETDKKKIKKTLVGLAKKTDLLILDVPGESVGKFATQFALLISNLSLIPMRSSTNDEQSFADNILPLIKKIVANDPKKINSFYIVPTFIHSQTKAGNVGNYFNEIMPDPIKCLPVFLPNRGVYENFSREGMNLFDYADSVKNNARFHHQAKQAIDDIEKIAKNILSLKH